MQGEELFKNNPRMGRKEIENIKMITGRCSVLLLYEGQPKPQLIGLTDNAEVRLAVARQLLIETKAGLCDAQELGDPFLILHFSGKLERLKTLLTMIVPGLEDEVLTYTANAGEKHAIKEVEKMKGDREDET